MVKPLSFKGEKKPKKRKRPAEETDPASTSTAVQKVENDEDTANDDSWVSAEAVPDVIGPVMVVLPTDTPSALACDGAGKVFALGIENIVDGNPVTSEPHDVRQVWVANKVAGTELFRFKGHHGRYLSCSKIGGLSATSEAVSPLESFTVIATSDTPGTFQLQSSSHEKFIQVKDRPTKTPEVRGDADTISFGTTLRIRMQARFKPRIKASKEEKAASKISRKELEDAVGRRLDDDEARMLKKARREGDYHEKMMDLRVKGKHDKYS